jgi:hypothetical protein
MVPAVLHLLTEISYLAADAGAQADVELNLIMGFGADAVNAEIAAHRGDWLGQMDHRVPTFFSFQMSGTSSSPAGSWGADDHRDGPLQVGHPLEQVEQAVLPPTARRRRPPGVGLVTTSVRYREFVGWNTAYVLLFARRFDYWGFSLRRFPRSPVSCSRAGRWPTAASSERWPRWAGRLSQASAPDALSDEPPLRPRPRPVRPIEPCGITGRRHPDVSSYIACRRSLPVCRSNRPVRSRRGG